MRVVPAIEITEAKIVSYNVPDLENPAWSPTTAYEIGDKVTLNHFNYEALVKNTNKNPATDTSQVPAWQNLGPNNRYAMFNKRRGNIWLIGTATTNPEVIDLKIRPGARINSFGMVGVRAASVRVIMTVPGSPDPVYDQTFRMSSKSGGSWYRYYFGQFVTKENLARLDLPPHSNAEVQFIISAPGGTARVGMLVVGMSRTIGVAVYDGSNYGTDSYTQTKIDTFGNQTRVSGGDRDFFNYSVKMTSDQASSAKRILAPLKDKPALYVGAEELDYTIIIGTYGRLAAGLPTYNLVDHMLEVGSLA